MVRETTNINNPPMLSSPCHHGQDCSCEYKATKSVYKVKYLMHRKGICQTKDCSNTSVCRVYFFSPFPKEELCEECKQNLNEREGK